MSNDGEATGGRRAAGAARNRAKLIAAARQAFADQGYAAASMDELTASVGLTRGALYHGFGDKRGLLRAVIAELDAEMAERLRRIREQAPDVGTGLIEEGVAYIAMALDPEVQRIMLLDGPAVLGDPSSWPGEQACLAVTMTTMAALRDRGLLGEVDVEAAARLLNGTALTAALWVAAADDPPVAMARAAAAFRAMAAGLLAAGTH